MTGLKSTITSYAKELGFDLVRVASASEFAEDRAVALERLRAGLMDGLPWYNEARVLRGTTPESLLPGARSIICLGLNYFQSSSQSSGQGPGERPASKAPVGKVARYAWGQDYHKVVKKRMRAYVDGLRIRLGREFAARWYIDDGPMLDRAAARRAGLGWFGKNTNILTPTHGSWVFLGQVVTDLEIEPDQPLKKTCGSCVRCIDACPTGAIVAPYIVDNTRCISYLTIENRGEIPVELRPLMGDWVFGCDICQDVCPVNDKTPDGKPNLWHWGDEIASGRSHGPVGAGEAPPSLALNREVEGRLQAREEEGSFNTLEERGQPLPRKIETLDLLDLLEMSEEDFRSRFRGSPILRAKRVGLQRNACVALGNLADPVAVPALRWSLRNGEILVRGHAAWALGRIGTTEAYGALEEASLAEEDSWVLREISDALDSLPTSQ